MKKFTRRALILSVILLIAGVVLWGIGVSKGGGYNQLKKDFIDGKFTIEYYGDNILTSDEILEGSIELDEGMNIIVSSGAAEMNLKTSDDGRFYVETEDDINWGIKGNDIVIERKRGIIDRKNDKGVDVYVPKGYRFKKVDIDCGAGAIYSESLNTDKLLIEVGVGEAVLNGVDADNIEAECGMGNIEISGDIKNGGELNCGMGNIDFNIDREYEYYDYDIECSMGNVTINGKDYAGFAIEKKTKNSSKNKFEIECSMGSVNIKTK